MLPITTAVAIAIFNSRIVEYSCIRVQTHEIHQTRTAARRTEPRAPICRNGLRCAGSLSADGVPDEPSGLAEALGKRPFAAASVGPAWFLSQLGAGVGLIAAHVFRWFHFADAVAGHRAVMGVAQQDGKKASLSICMDLRVAPASRAANRLLCSLFPLPPSDAPWGVDHLPSLSPSRRPEQIFPARPNARNGYRSLSAVRTRADNRTSRFSARARCHR
jgi:hypothetical protein